MSAFNINLCLPDTGYSNLSGKLDISKVVTPSDEKQKASEDKIPDESSCLSIGPDATKDFDGEKKDSPKDEVKTVKKSVSDQKDLPQESNTAVKHTMDSGEKSISEDSKRKETVSKKTSLDDEKSKTSKQSEIHETASGLKDKIADSIDEEEGETKQISEKTVAKKSSESIESKENEDLKYDEKSTGVSSMESMNVEKSLSPGKTPQDKKSDNRERPEIETSKSNIYYIL